MRKPTNNSGQTYISKLKIPLRNVEGRTGIFEVIDLKNVDIEKLEIGKISEESGRASIEYI